MALKEMVWLPQWYGMVWHGYLKQFDQGVPHMYEALQLLGYLHMGAAYHRGSDAIPMMTMASACEGHFPDCGSGLCATRSLVSVYASFQSVN